MAIAYPQGEVYFRRKNLSMPAAKSSQGKYWSYDAEDENDFYKHCLVEHCSNNCLERAVHRSNRVHSRSKYRDDFKHPWYNTCFGIFEELPITYGEKADPKRRFQVPLNLSTKDYRDRDAGGPLEVRIVVVPMSTKDEKWMWFDMVTQIRAIYFPIALKSDEAYPELCTFIQISFTYEQSVNIWRPGSQSYLGEMKPHQMSSKYGLDVAWDSTLGINVNGVYNLLCLPLKLRKTDVYKGKLVEIVGMKEVVTKPNPGVLANLWHSFASIASANCGLELSWRSYEYTSFTADMIKSLSATGLSLIPVPGVGALLSFSFSLGLTLLLDPEQFEKDAKGNNMDRDTINALVGSVGDVLINLPGGFKKGKAAASSLALLTTVVSSAKALHASSDKQERENLDYIKPVLNFSGQMSVLVQPGMCV